MAIAANLPSARHLAHPRRRSGLFRRGRASRHTKRHRAQVHRGSDTMSNLQDVSSLRCAISGSVATRGAESPPSRIMAITDELKDALAREAALLRERDE